MVKQRLDILLVELNLCNSRALAQRLIQTGEVMVHEQVIDKPGCEVNAAAQIKIKERSPTNIPKKRSQFLARFWQFDNY